MPDNIVGAGSLNNIDPIFITSCPLNNIISLSRDRYIAHISKHEEITSPDLIKQSIEEANVITIDKDRKDVYNYHWNHNDPVLSLYASYVKVPVDFSCGSFAGNVLTAYCDEIHPKDTPLWKK